MMQSKPKSQTDLRTAIFLELIGILAPKNLKELEHIADQAGCHKTTLYKWCHGETCFPRLDKVVNVAQVLGYELTLKRVSKKPILKRIK